AVRDPAFWVYGHAVLFAVHGCLYEFQNFLESCPCHAEDFRMKDGFAPGRPYFKRRVAFVGETGVKFSTCPMRGRRAPDLAAGQHNTYLRDLVDQSLGLLLVRCHGLREQDRDFIVRGWECARTALMEVIQSKYSHWAFLPHRFCVLGAIDAGGASEDTARSGLLACLQEYEALDESTRSGLWPLAARTLDPSSPLRGEVVAFTEHGAPLSSLPGLRQVAGMVLGVPVAERSIEAKHRLNKLSSSRSPHAGGAFVNVHLKLPDFRRRMKADPGLLQRTADDLGRIRCSTERLLEAFGLHAHPAVFAEFTKHGRVRASTATNVIYRLDPATQQKQHTALKGAFPKEKRPSEGPRPDQSTHHGLRFLSAAALQHFRKTCRRDAFYSIALPRGAFPDMGAAFSGSRRLDAPAVLTLTDEEYTPPLMLPAGAAAHAGGPEGGLDLAAPGGVPPAMEPHEHTLLKVVHKTPASRKIIKPHSSNLTHDDVAVSLHDVFGYDRLDGSTELLVALTGVRAGEAAVADDHDFDAAIDVGSTSLLHRRHLEALPRLHLDFLQWQAEGGVFYQPRAWPASVPRDLYGNASEAMTDMVVAGALPGAETSLLAPPSRALEALEEAGLVDRQAGDLGDQLDRWNISPAGMRDLAAFEKLVKPAPALTARPGVLDKDKTLFELLLDASSEGFAGQLLPRPPPAPYDPKGGAKVWFYQASKKKICPAYIRALLQGKSVVAHGLADRDYALIAGAVRPAQKRVALQDDTWGVPQKKAAMT
ncbi:unnamed protein product, partial [Prorocentrum cordatum]